MKLAVTYEFKKVPGGARVKSRSKPKLLAWPFLGVRLVSFIRLFIGINEASCVYTDVSGQATSD